jgi:uncharacterized membrane protein YfcA
MDDNTLQALTQLAQKLGTTAEYLMGVLIKQGPISGLIDLLIMAIMAYGSYIGVRLVLRKNDDDNEIAVVFGWIGIVTFCIVTSLVILLQLNQAITGIIHPEFWALQQILNR